MDIKELEKKFTELSDNQEKIQKDFTLKLESAQRDAKQFKELAEKREEENRQLKDRAESAEKEKAKAFSESKKAEVKSFVEAQVKAGKIIPAHKEAVVSFMESLTSEGEVASFTDKNGSKVSHSQLSLFKDIISKMKQVVPVNSEFSVHEVVDGEESGDTTEEKFMEVRSEGTIQKLPLQDEALALKAFEYQAEQLKLGRTIDYGEALIAVAPKRKIKA